MDVYRLALKVSYTSVVDFDKYKTEPRSDQTQENGQGEDETGVQCE